MSEYKPGELVPGHLGPGVEIDIELPGIPANAVLAICRPTRLGASAAPDPLVTNCAICGTTVWRSPRAPEGMVIVCYFCMDEHAPEGWESWIPGLQR